MEISNSTYFKYKWNLYYYCDNNNNWNEDSFEKIYTIENPNHFWKLYNNWNILGGITNNQFFLMRDKVLPLWEDPININGGCWAYKIHESHSSSLWEDLSMYLVLDELCLSISEEIVGISISLKKNNICLIKIWNTNSKNNSLSLINKDIIKKYGINIIYIANLTK